MDQWHVYGTLEMNDPYDKRSDKCIVCSIRSLHRDAPEALISISVNRWHERGLTEDNYLENIVMVAMFSFTRNCVHKCLIERDQEPLRYYQVNTLFLVI